MPDVPSPIVHGASKQAVAYALMIGIAKNEGKVQFAGSTPVVQADADYVLDLFTRCMNSIGD